MELWNLVHWSLSLSVCPPPWCQNSTPFTLGVEFYTYILCTRDLRSLPRSLSFKHIYYISLTNYHIFYKQFLTEVLHRLDSVWKSYINTMTEKRDKFGRRIYIFRLGPSQQNTDKSSINQPDVKVAGTRTKFFWRTSTPPPTVCWRWRPEKWRPR